jgi:hypothetical protein
MWGITPVRGMKRLVHEDAESSDHSSRGRRGGNRSDVDNNEKEQQHQ